MDLSLSGLNGKENSCSCARNMYTITSKIEIT